MDAAATASPFYTLCELLPTGAALLAPVLDDRQRVVDFTFGYLNPAAQRLLGLPAHPPGTVGSELPQHGPSGLLAQYCQAYERGERQQLERRYRGEGGERRTHLVVQRTADWLLVYATDVASWDESQVAQQLRRSRRREQARRQDLGRQRQQWQQLLERAPAAIGVFGGPNWVHEFINPGYQALFPGRTLLGKPLLAALPELVGQPLVALLRRVCETGETFDGVAVPVSLARTADGPVEDRYFDLTYQARTNAQGQVDGFVTYAYEVTARVRDAGQVRVLNQDLAAVNQELAVANEQLRTTNAELHTSNASLTRVNADLDTFVYTASHDLRGPLTDIQGLLRVLREEVEVAQLHPTASVGQVLRLLDDSVARFQQTLNQLTTVMALPPAGLVSWQLPVVDVAALAEGVRLDLHSLLHTTQGQLLVEVHACPELRIAPKDLRSILYNLISNALKYRAPSRPPVVRVRLTCTPQQTELTVQDNGLGLTRDQMGHLFQLFARLHPHVEGTGVGLYAIHRLITNAGGTIAVESELGTGSLFRVCLPQQGLVVAS